MKSKHWVKLVLPSLPTPFKVPLTELEQLAIWVGLVITGLGGGLFLLGHPTWGSAFGGVGLLVLLYAIIGYIKFLLDVKKNKAEFFDYIRDAVEKETGVKMSNSVIARMWVEGPVKTRTHRFFAESRKGKEFTVKVY